ncbi:MAG: hypothetical protein WCW13_02510 [archaeon]|jgi:hypothetical protein
MRTNLTPKKPVSVSSVSKQSLVANLRNRVSQALKESKKQQVFGRVRVGTKGVSGFHGTDLTPRMINTIHFLSKSNGSPNRELALKVSTVLSAAREGRVEVFNYSGEHQILVNIVNGILAAEKGEVKFEFKLNSTQAKLLDKYFGLTRSRTD